MLTARIKKFVGDEFSFPEFMGRKKSKAFLALVGLVILCLIAGRFFTIHRLRHTPGTWWDIATLACVSVATLAMAVALYLLLQSMVASFLRAAWPNGQEYIHWASVLAAFFPLALTAQLAAVWRGPRTDLLTPANIQAPNAVATINIVAFLLLVAFGLYVFKKYWKFYYGISELIIGIASNVALLSRIDMPSLTHFKLVAQDYVGLSVFTYLLSRGMSNIFDGLQEQSEKRAKET